MARLRAKLLSIDGNDCRINRKRETSPRCRTNSSQYGSTKVVTNQEIFNLMPKLLIYRDREQSEQSAKFFYQAKL